MQNASVPQHISCADTLPMIRERHPRVADHMLVSLSQGRGGFHLEATHESRDRLLRVDRGQRPGSHPTTSSPVSLTWGGSLLLRLKSKKFSLTPPCGRVWTPHTGFWSDLREAPWRASRSCHLSRLVRPSEFQGPPSASPLVPVPVVFCNLPVWPAT